eukprot:TRINITY_DN13919_c1_g2_i1.p1 TRINITY_DN13919_c1_g2~~TRINITY_DN13919_c1_g2_i1.p1  ORF type:complete len:555 (-),score=71.53 TRINITY_DN13919_c1_g2_i1:281-1945(-)
MRRPGQPRHPGMTHPDLTAMYPGSSNHRSPSNSRIQGFGGLTLQRPASRGGLLSPDATPKSRTSSGFVASNTGGFGHRRSVCSASTACNSPKSPSRRSEVDWERNADVPESAALRLARVMQTGFPASSSRSSSRAGSRAGSRAQSPASPSASRSLQAASGLVLSRPGSRQMDRAAASDCAEFYAAQQGIEQVCSVPDEFKSRLLLRRANSSLASLSVDVLSPPRRGQRRRSSYRGMKEEEIPKFHGKEIRMLRDDEKIFDLYSWDKVLQEDGDGGKVVVCSPKDYDVVPNGVYVLKFRSKKSLMESAMEESFRKSLLNLLNLPEHVGVLPLIEVLEDDHFYYTVMEQANDSFFGGLLSEFNDGGMPPKEVRRLTRGIFEAVGHVHNQGMLHRDIKPDNLVMRSHDDEMSPTGKSRRVAIIDFDHADSDWRASARTSQDFCGTMYFSAPETFRGFFSQSSDLYSVGIIMYLLMAGKMPYDTAMFDEANDVLDRSPKSKSWASKLYNRLKESEIDWECDPWPMQPACCDFCKWLLAFDPSQRPASAEQALEHVWFA